MNNQFSLILKLLRKDKGYTQKQLSSLLSVGQTTIANYENSIRIPDISKLIEIADLFNVSLDYLTGRQIYKLENSGVRDKNKTIDLNYSYEDYFINLLDGNKGRCIDICLNILKEDDSIINLYQKIICTSLIDIGLLWEKGEIDIWKEHFVSELSIDIMKSLYPQFSSNKSNKNKTVIGLTPGAEIHNIGLRMACDIFNMKGWDSIYLGCNIPTLSVLNAISETKPEAILLSVTMPIHIEATKNLIIAIRKFYNKKSLSILVGGSAFKNIKDVTEIINADYYFKNFQDINSYLTPFQN